MTTFVVRRLLQLIVTVLGGFTLLFVLFFMLPDDPAQILAGSNGRNPDPQVVANISAKYGFDQSLPAQYWCRLRETFTLTRYCGTATGTELTSFKGGEPISEMVSDRLPVSLRLAVGAVLVESIFGIAGGVLSARRRNSLADTVTTMAAVLAGAIPVFLLAFVIKQVTGVYAYEHHWPAWARFPALGLGENSWTLGIVPSADTAKHIIQPIIVLAAVSMAIIARLTRTTMLEATNSDHVRTAKAKGLKDGVVVRRHILRNALIPVVTYIGIDFGTLVGSAILTETVFNIPGIGSKISEAAGSSDLPTLLTLSTIVIVIYALASLAVDLSYAWLDPRIRVGGAA